jgi:hypothetical protein
MSNKKSALELFPNLFAAQPAKAPAREMSSSDMRLLQYAMRQATRRPAMPPRVTGPVGRPPAPAPVTARRPETGRVAAPRPLPRTAQR